MGLLNISWPPWGARPGLSGFPGAPGLAAAGLAAAGPKSEKKIAPKMFDSSLNPKKKTIFWNLSKAAGLRQLRLDFLNLEIIKHFLATLGPGQASLASKRMSAADRGGIQMGAEGNPGGKQGRTQSGKPRTHS